MTDEKATPPEVANQSFDLLTSILWADADDALRLAAEKPTGFNKRAAFRAVFASIEGTTSALKHQVMALWPGRRRLYTDAEAAVLREENFDLDRSGTAKARPKVLPPDLNFRFAMAMYMRELPVVLSLDTSSDGWRAFQESLRIRNRVTHPRLPEHIEVASADIAQLERAHNWVRSTVARNMATALLEWRQRDYRTWDVRLPDAARSWLDTLNDGLLAEGNCQPIELPGGEMREHASRLNMLATAGLIRRDGSAVLLTQVGKDYTKWRRHGRQ